MIGAEPERNQEARTKSLLEWIMKWLTGVTAPLIILTAGAVGAFIHDKLDFEDNAFHSWLSLGTGAIVVLAGLFVLGCVAVRLARAVSQRARSEELVLVGQEIGTIRTYVEQYQAAVSSWMGHLKTPEAMADFEARVATREIWVATVDLDHDMAGGLFATAIAENIKRGITYKFLIPKLPGLTAKAHELQATYGNKVRFFGVEPERLTPLVHTNVIVYNARQQNPTIVFEELQISEDAGKRLWAELSRYSATTTEGHLDKLLFDKETPEIVWEGG